MLGYIKNKMASIEIPNDVIIKYDNNNILFEFPVPVLKSEGSFYYMIHDLTATIQPIKVPLNATTYNLVDGVTPGNTYVFRVRACDTKGNKSMLTSAIVITIPHPSVIAEEISAPEPAIVEETSAPEPAPEELALNYVTAVLDNAPILEDAPQIINNFPGIEEPLYIYSETIILQMKEPNHVPAVNSSKYIESKNNLYLANGYQGRVKYDFETLLKIRMGKVTTTLK